MFALNGNDIEVFEISVLSVIFILLFISKYLLTLKYKVLLKLI